MINSKEKLWTVKDLIEALSKFPKDMLVATCHDDEVEEVHGIDIEKAILYNGQICERGFDLGGIEAPEIDVVMVW